MVEIWAFLQTMFGKNYHLLPAWYTIPFTMTALKKKETKLTVNTGYAFVLTEFMHTSTGAFSGGFKVNQNEYQSALVPHFLWGNSQDAAFGNWNPQKKMPFLLRQEGGKDIFIITEDSSGAGNTGFFVGSGVHLLSREVKV